MQPVGVAIGSGCSNISIGGATQLSGTTSPLQLGTGVSNLFVGDGVLGISDRVPDVVAATALVLPVNPLFKLHGAVDVHSVSFPRAAGASVQFVATAPQPGLWRQGPTIGSSFRPTQNVLVSCAWDGAKLFCRA